MNEQIKVMPRYSEDPTLSEKLKQLLEEKDLADKTALAVIYFNKKDSKDGTPTWAGSNAEYFFYPASLYKLYVAGALLKDAVKDPNVLKQKIMVSEQNATDKEKEVEGDPRPLLFVGEEVSVNYLLKLMITRSDNSAANCLIDFVGRKKINKFIKQQGWQGSEVTRKFLPRDREDEEYRDAVQTKTCALHLAEFLLAIEQENIGSKKLSHMLKILLHNQLDVTKFRGGLPHSIDLYHKTGWFTAQQETITGVCGDAGIAEDGDLIYVYACMLKLPPEEGNQKLCELAKPLYDLVAEHIKL